MSDAEPTTMNVEEYLRSEDESLYKREYVSGFVYPLHGSTPDRAGTSAAHNLIGGNIFGTLHPVARRLGYDLFAFSLKLWIEPSRSFLYPDVMLVDSRQRSEPEAMFVSAPSLLVEIISENSEIRDRVGKYGLYTALPSLQSYLIVNQDERRVYAYSRGGSGWTLQELIGEGEIYLPSLDRSLTLAEIYDGALP